MFLLVFHRKWTALAFCKSFESAIQWFQIHHELPLQPYKIQLYTFRVQELAIVLSWFPDYIGLCSKLLIVMLQYRLYSK